MAGVPAYIVHLSLRGVRRYKEVLALYTWQLYLQVHSAGIQNKGQSYQDFFSPESGEKSG